MNPPGIPKGLPAPATSPLPGVQPYRDTALTGLASRMMHKGTTPTITATGLVSRPTKLMLMTTGFSADKPATTTPGNEPVDSPTSNLPSPESVSIPFGFEHPSEMKSKSFLPFLSLATTKAHLLPPVPGSGLTGRILIVEKIAQAEPSFAFVRQFLVLSPATFASFAGEKLTERILGLTLGPEVTLPALLAAGRELEAAVLFPALISPAEEPPNLGQGKEAPEGVIAGEGKPRKPLGKIHDC